MLNKSKVVENSRIRQKLQFTDNHCDIHSLLAIKLQAIQTKH